MRGKRFDDANNLTQQQVGQVVKRHWLTFLGSRDGAALHCFGPSDAAVAAASSLRQSAVSESKHPSKRVLQVAVGRCLKVTRGSYGLRGLRKMASKYLLRE